MNKELEALNRLISFDKECNYVSQAVKDDFNLVEQALKRNEPMKPNYGGKFPQCPVCRKLLHSIWQKHCDGCGQKLDLGDDDE